MGYGNQHREGRRDAPRRNDRQRPPRNNAARLYVANVPYGASQVEVREEFEAYGRTEDVYVPRDPEREGRNRGFAFVQFADTASADAALNAGEAGQIAIDGRKLLVRPARDN